MKAWDYEGVDLFAADGSGHIGTYCNECFATLHPTVDINAEHVAPIFATDERDYYPSCEWCGYVFDYINLTEEGYEYIQQLGLED